ncbi:MAG: hypothetical protein APF76_01385 [Desulfitibacter sp. BRH_c19]|nr:MAG: hypothetical protein APF76_01385 [Desulfitibacter sp. BRH_c19]
MKSAIEVNNLTKKFGTTTALANINLSFDGNKIYGLLGRNGAGKTTLLHLLAAQLLPSNGSISIRGESLYENNNALSQICYIGLFLNNNKYIKTFKVKDFLKSAAMFFPNWDEKLAKQLTELFSLDIKKPYRNLSTGMLSMVSIIISLASRAPITLLDEPYSGLDASARQEFYDVLAEDFGRHPRTIVFSTHLIDEASNLFEDVIILHQGKIVLHEPMETLEESSLIVFGDKDELESRLGNKRVIHRELFGHRASYALFDKISEQEKTAWTHAGLELRSLTLQQLFVHLTANSGR